MGWDSFNIKAICDIWVTSRTARDEYGFTNDIGTIIGTDVLGLNSRSVLD